MTKLSVKSEKALKNLEFRLTFWRHKTYECFSAPNANYDKCKIDAR